MFTLTEHNAIISGRYRSRKTLTEEFSITNSSESITQCSSGGMTWKCGAINLKTLWTWSWTFKLMIRLGLRVNRNNQINFQITKRSKNRIFKHFSIDWRNRQQKAIDVFIQSRSIKLEELYVNTLLQLIMLITVECRTVKRYTDWIFKSRYLGLDSLCEGMTIISVRKRRKDFLKIAKDKMLQESQNATILYWWIKNQSGSGRSARNTKTLKGFTIFHHCLKITFKVRIIWICNLLTNLIQIFNFLLFGPSVLLPKPI